MIDQLYEDVKHMDSDDPSAMEKVREYLIALNDEDEQYMQLLSAKIGHLEIDWPRPWYQLFKCLTRPLKQDNEDVMTEETFKKDSITVDEMAIIDKNWRKLVKKYNIPDKPICFARWRNKDRNHGAPEEKTRYFITAYLARGLQRTLHQVHKHIVANYGAPLKGQYSPQEKKIMEICFENDPLNAATICAVVLGREPRGLYKKLNISVYGNKVPKKRMKWTLPLASKLLKLLMEHTNLSLKELKNRRFGKDVWVKLEDEMEHYYEYLQMFWYRSLHVQLFVKDYVTLRRLRKKIYKKLMVSSYKAWSDIRWRDLLQMFPDGFTYQFLYAVASRGIIGFSDYLKVPLEVVLEYGLDKLKKSHYDKALKTLILDKNGELIPSMVF